MRLLKWFVVLLLYGVPATAVLSCDVASSNCEPPYISWLNTICTWTFRLNFGCLVITFVVYALLPKLQTLSDWIFMCHVATLTAFYSLSRLMRMDIYNNLSVMCTVSQYTKHFLTLANFFWWNIMSIDIYWTFAGSRGRTTDRRKFLYYCLYACGAPLLFVSLILLFDHTELISYYYWQSDVGEKGCWVFDTTEIWFLYYHLPKLLLNITSTILFVITAKRISRAVQSNVDSKDRKRFSLYLRVFLIGIATWIPYLIGLLMHYPLWIYDVLAICNHLGDTTICFLLVWKQKVKKLLLQQFFQRKSVARDDHIAYSSAQTVHFNSLTSGDQAH